MSEKPTIAVHRRLVVKVGSALLTGSDGRLNRDWLGGLLDDIRQLGGGDRQLLVVSSGAVALGCRALGLERGKARLDEQQAAAAVGQVRLAHAWQEGLEARGLSCAQILLTPDDTERRRRFLNARATLEKLLDLGAVPVINENDSVATDELRYGDNDRLAARVAQLVMADGLVLLSDVDGLYTADPRIDPGARHVAEVSAVDPDTLAMAGDSLSAEGSGGMRTKLAAARIASRAGCETWIASGRVERPLSALMDGARCTRIRAAGTPAAVRKQWLAGLLSVDRALRVDDGAAAALADGGSLLSVGIRTVEGRFERGDAVTLLAADGRELGRGLAAYSSGEVERIAGCRSGEIESRLGYRGRAVVVHRDDLVLFAGDG